MAKPPSQVAESTSKLPELRWWWVLAVALGAALLTAGAMWLLLATVRSSPDANSARTELDAIRTALAIGVGAGGVFTLWLAVRRQRSTEIQIRETVKVSAEEKEHREQTRATTELDLTERRITELYTKAVEQLGSDKAPVRLGGLYALERLGNGNPALRQTIVNVVCAYLRMPYPKPTWRLERLAAADLTEDIPMAERLSREELQVRLTAQQLLASHLREPVAELMNWGPLDIDLRDAVLVDFRLEHCTVGSADFHGAHFFDTARFNFTVFHGETWLYETTFDTMAIFEHTRFLDRAIFTRSHFGWNLYASNAEFHDEAFFEGVQYSGLGDFQQAQFHGSVEFDQMPIRKPLDEKIADKPAWEDIPDSIFNFDGAEVLGERGNTIVALPDYWSVAIGTEITHVSRTSIPPTP